MKNKYPPADAKVVSLMLHAKGQRDRLLAANRHQVDDIFALTAALREVYGILRTRSLNLTDRERIDLASTHISSALSRFAAFTPKSAAHARSIESGEVPNGLASEAEA